jgi:RNA polymerase sigma-70 factor (ECF subfamily)
VERSDRDLVRESRAGNTEAFRELVERYQRKVAAVAMGMVHNRDDALELTQETFVKAFENIDKFKGESSFYTWLYRIVVNLGIDFQRRERRHPTVTIEDRTSPSTEVSDEITSQQGNDPFREVRAREIGDRVAQAINELTPDHKAVIILREVEGLSYEEISRVMQCSKGTVMSRLHYARKKLQSKLRDCL